MTVYILGGGPAGLAIAHGLAESKKDRFLLLERSSILGGLAQTVDWDGIGSHDLGPHKIFTLDKNLERRVESLLQDSDWLTRNKVGKIYMNGKFLPYPPSPFSLSGVFGFMAFVRMVTDYGFALILSSIPGQESPKTFEQDLKRRVGNSLLNLLFAPIARKLWGEPFELDVKLSQGRVQTPTFLELIKRTLGISSSSNFEALTFRYPIGGLRRLWLAIQQRSSGAGEFKNNAEITRIEHSKGRVTAVVYRDLENEAIVTKTIDEDDFVASTLPLGLLSRIMPDFFTSQEIDDIKSVLRLNDLILVFLHYKQKSLFEESWTFVPDPNIAFHRISEQESFDPSMTPNGTIVCCEIMSGPHRPMGTYSDEELIRMAENGIKIMGYSDVECATARVIRLPQTYPVFLEGYEEKLNGLITKLDMLENFRSVGRQGAFNYIGTLDAMDIGYGFSKWYTQGKNEGWLKERNRTSHYDVLD